MSAEAGPSKIKKTKSKVSVKKTASPSPAPQVLSKETIDDSDEDMSDEEMDGSSSEGSDSADSEGNLETIEPKRKAAGGGRLPTARGNAKSLPRFVPPPGLEPITVTTTFKDSPFEYDRLSSNPSLELWAIRLPSDFKPSRLSSLSISDISDSVTGTLQTRHTPYDLVPAGVSSPSSHMVVDDEGRQPTAGPGMVDSMTMQDEVLRREGGEEMGGGMRLLVPRLSADGKLLVAPIPIKRHLLLTPRISDNVPAGVQDERPLPSFLSTTISSTNANNVQDGLPPKRTQPAHLLKFRNRAFGFDTPGPDGIIALDTSNANKIAVDDTEGHENALDAAKKGHKNKSTSETAEKSPRKRKVENGVTPEKKKKKVKA